MEKPSKESGINRVVGTSEEEREEILDYFARSLKKENIKRIGIKEHPQELDQIIQKINIWLAEFVRRYGGTPVEVPYTNVFIPDLDRIDEKNKSAILNDVESGTKGTYDSLGQKIFVLFDYDSKSKLKFMATMVHELMHLNSFNSVEAGQKDKDSKVLSLVEKDNKGSEMSLYLRRVGWVITGPGKQNYFELLNEAVTSELAMRFDWEYFDNIPELSEELREREVAIREFAKREGGDILEAREKIAFLDEFPIEDNSDMVNVKLVPYTYEAARKSLWGMAEIIYKANQDEFNSKEEVVDLFIRAYFNGKILPVARLYEKTFGKGSFRELGKKTIMER